MMLCALASAASAKAQTTAIQVTVPFAFHTALQTLPAGTYRIEVRSEHLIGLSAGPHASGVVLTNPVVRLSGLDKGKLVFRHYGSRYFLAEIWQPGNPTGLKVVKGREEKEAQLALNAPAASTVELALNAAPR
jgi:hypothetical protein